MNTRLMNIRQTPSGFRKINGVQFGQYVYIGRPGRFGNPVAKGSHCPVCRTVHVVNGSTLGCYEHWLTNRLREDAIFRQHVKDLHGRTLVCFCRPDQPCHGTILAHYADQLALKNTW